MHENNWNYVGDFFLYRYHKKINLQYGKRKFLFLEIVNVSCLYKRDNLTGSSFYKRSEISFFSHAKLSFCYEKNRVVKFRLIKKAPRRIISSRLAKGVVSVNEDVPVARTKGWTNETSR